MRVLIVDPSDTDRYALRRAACQAGVRADQFLFAANLEEARGHLREGRPDLAFCEWRVPDASEGGVLSLLVRRRCVAVGVITNHYLPPVVERAGQLGALFVERKPLTPHRLREVLDEVFVPLAPVRAVALAVGM